MSIDSMLPVTKRGLLAAHIRTHNARPQLSFKLLIYKRLDHDETAGDGLHNACAGSKSALYNACRVRSKSLKSKQTWSPVVVVLVIVAVTTPIIAVAQGVAHKLPNILLELTSIVVSVIPTIIMVPASEDKECQLTMKHTAVVISAPVFQESD